MTSVNSEQSLNARYPTLVILSGSVIDVNALQPSKAKLSIFVSDVGKLISVSEAQFLKAAYPIYFNVLGSMTPAKPSHPSKAVGEILVVPFLMATAIPLGMVPLYLYRM